jgi:hypothetical protein
MTKEMRAAINCDVPRNQSLSRNQKLLYQNKSRVYRKVALFNIIPSEKT